MRYPKSSPAFSLVELSIVLVILGLLVGGVLSGQSLIRAAELRSITTEQNRWLSAIQSFRDKYFALPGDITNAQSFWGVQHATPNTCATQASTDARTCNGNGDGNILWWIGSDEEARSWQHLANAGLIEGRYTGVGAAPASSFAPVMKIGRANNWYLRTFTTSFAGNTTSFARPAWGNTLFFYNEAFNGILKPEEAWNIDTKIDDGRPNGGKVLAPKGSTSLPCTDRAEQAVAAADANAQYNLASSIASCDLTYIAAF